MLVTLSTVAYEFLSGLVGGCKRLHHLCLPTIWQRCHHQDSMEEWSKLFSGVTKTKSHVFARGSMLDT